MAQTAYRNVMEIPFTWTLVSEINFTFMVNEGEIEVLAEASATPAETTHGGKYRSGDAESSDTDLLTFFGPPSANQIHMRSVGGMRAQVFVNRAAVA